MMAKARKIKRTIIEVAGNRSARAGSRLSKLTQTYHDPDPGRDGLDSLAEPIKSKTLLCGNRLTMAFAKKIGATRLKTGLDLGFHPGTGGKGKS